MPFGEKEIARVQQAQAARLIAEQLRDIVIDLQDDIMNRLVSRYRAGELTNQDTRGAVGELAGIQSLLDTLETRARKSKESI